jgi:PIN domain nuclease of toxin-antitoxin system
VIVLDTHAWLWWVSDPSRLSRAAHRPERETF